MKAGFRLYAAPNHSFWEKGALTGVDVSVVLGSLNRKRLLAHAIDSVRSNGFKGKLEIIVVDGGSRDGTREWLAQQKDISTIVQPNYNVRQADGTLRRAHTWGEFINLGFRAASAPWIVMISDDVILCPGAIESGLRELESRSARGEKIGGGAFFYRDYPRSVRYHVKLLPGGFVHINHGFFNKDALEFVGYADASSFEFYGADADLTMRLNLNGWSTIALHQSYAEHLNHRVDLHRGLNRTSSVPNSDMTVFFARYPRLGYDQKSIAKSWYDSNQSARPFWFIDPLACFQGMFLRYVGNSA
jgi:glycosyltransferase involved in cell wall biosynthesis